MHTRSILALLVALFCWGYPLVAEEETAEKDPPVEEVERSESPGASARTQAFFERTQSDQQHQQLGLPNVNRRSVPHWDDSDIPRGPKPKPIPHHRWVPLPRNGTATGGLFATPYRHRKRK